MTEPTALAQLRHLYQNMVNGAVRDTASAKRMAEGLLAPAIEALERGTPPAVAGEPVAWYEYARKKPSLRRLVFERTSRKDLRTAGWVAEPLYATPQPTQAQAGVVPPTYEQVIAAWNAQADEHNQWGDLGEGEKIEWAVACAKAAPPAVVAPLTDEQITEIWAAKVRYHAAPIGSTDLEFARDIERAHGIGIKKGDSHA